MNQNVVLQVIIKRFLSIFFFNSLIFNNLEAQIIENTPLSILGKNAAISEIFHSENLNENQNAAVNNENTPLSIFGQNEQKKQFSAQQFNLIHWLQVPDSFNRKRFIALQSATLGGMVGAGILLNNVWYAQYPKAPFQTFNDFGEWMDVDKAGHVLTAYTVSKWFYGAERWTGLSPKKAAWLGMGVGTAAQLTLEILDGTSAEWGFSWSDIASNTAGCALFGLQQVAWNEQRMVLKVSNFPKKYPNKTLFSADGKSTTLKERADDLFGDNYTQTFFKDYNALIFWVSVNPSSFIKKESKFPKWLNIAVGMGGENMFGGFRNEWPKYKPTFFLSPTEFPRYRQLYLSLDVDLSRIKTKSRLANMLLKTFNFIKIPAPAIEFNTLGKVKFHPFIF
jgi:Predicted periplasmic lipoprotein (DUF2279)